MRKLDGYFTYTAYATALTGVGRRQVESGGRPGRNMLEVARAVFGSERCKDAVAVEVRPAGGSGKKAIYVRKDGVIRRDLGTERQERAAWKEEGARQFRIASKLAKMAQKRKAKE